MKRTIKYFLVVLSAIATAYLIAIALLLLQANFIKNDIASLFHAIESGATVASQEKLTSKIDHEISRTANVLNSPFFHPIVRHYMPAPNAEFFLMRTLIKLAPTVLGSEAPKKYLIVFQNSAEARGTGGIIGAFAEIEISRGKITILRQGSNAGLQSLNDIPITMPSEYANVYGSDPAIWQNSNMSPHFPYAAKIWSALWQKQFNEKLDGVIATDPTALSYVLRATGPITLESGEKISANNVVEKTLSTAYQRFATDNDARKEYLVEVMKTVMQQLINGGYSKLTFAREVQTPLRDRRILFALSNPRDQSSLLPTIISGNLDNKANNEFRAVIQNISGNKLDYYLRKETHIQSKACSSPLQTTISVTITNTLRNFSSLPDYVKGRLDLNQPHGINGRHGFTVMIYGPTAAEAISVIRSDAGQEGPALAQERGRPIAVFNADLAPMASETYTVTFAGGTGHIGYVKQALVIPEQISIQDGCR